MQSKPPWIPGKWTPFPQAVKLKPGEAVCFSRIVYKSRDQVMVSL